MLEEQQAAWETQKTGVPAEADDREAGLDALARRPDSQRLALEKERRQWESQCREAMALESTKTEELAALKSKSRRGIVPWTKNGPLGKARRVKPGTGLKPGARVAESGGRVERPQSERLEERQRQHETQLAELQSRENELEERRRALESSIAATRSPVPRGEIRRSGWRTDRLAGGAARDGRPTEAKPVAETETVKTITPSHRARRSGGHLRQSGFNVDRMAEEEQSAKDVPPKDESPDSEAAEKPSPIFRRLSPAGGNPLRRGKSKKYRSTNNVAPVRAVAGRFGAVARTGGRRCPERGPLRRPPRPAVPAPSSPEPQGEPAKSSEPVEITPRAVAPETQVDLNAMRQLANLSAN